MRFNKIKKLLIPLFLLTVTLLTRFCFLNWGNGYFFNPDENNMATSIVKMDLSNFNPNFFAYGQFPLFLTFLTTPWHNFSNIILTLRFWSATFSALSIYFFYLISQIIFKSKKISFIFTLLLIFTPGLIQLAHFGTTESILIFVFSSNLFLSLKYYQRQKKRYLLFSILFSAIGFASKITAIFFTLPIYLCLFFIFLKDKKISKFISAFLIFTFALSYDPIRPRQHIRRDHHTDLLGGLQVDYKLKLRRLLNGNIGGFCAFQDFVDKVSGAPP